MKQLFLDLCNWICANPLRALFFIVLGGTITYILE